MRASSPAPRDCGLTGLHGLEWRYDGPLPAGALAALSTTGTEIARRRANADAALVDRLALDAVRARAAQRGGGGTAEHGAAAGQLAACREAGLILRRRGAGPAG